jgi:hypothetical protein
MHIEYSLSQYKALLASLIWLPFVNSAGSVILIVVASYLWSVPVLSEISKEDEAGTNVFKASSTANSTHP